jgi:RHS repeat-associated protein
MNTRFKFHYKSGFYFLNFPSNVILKTVFTDGFESMSSWKYIYSDTWIPINNSEDIYYTVSGWVYVEDVTTNGYLPNLAKLWIVTRKEGERGYPTGHISTSSTKEGTWEYLSKTVLVPADVKEINVRIENARLGKVWFDDVKIVKGNTSETVIVEESNYYPFGLKHQGYNGNYNPLGNSTAQKFKLQGQELEEELGKNTYAYQWRDYDPALGRFNKIDRFAIKYESHSPYGFTKNNPIRYREMKGDSIWTSKRVAKNGYTYITTHVRGKVLNLSDRNINMKKYAKQLQKKLGNALYATDKKNKIRYRSDVQIEAVDSASEVDSSDHLQVIVDNVEGKADPDKGGNAAGVATSDGKISYVDSGGLFGSSSLESMSTLGTHEMGHNFGLEHAWKDGFKDTDGGQNYMDYNHGTQGFSLKQLILITRNIEHLNQGSPTQKAPSSSNNWFYHKSTTNEPYDFNVKKGDIIPTIIKI